ncbi:MAG: copper amine oxidase N-terminal domain-containing protein [Anaerotignum sp.]|nr:copper amine oxidase N-terminal domain-containing protein [Anaerotignum sp.]
MTIKKLTVIAAAGAVLLAGAIGLSMNLTSQHEVEMEVPETAVVEGTENTDGSKTLGNMENIPLYYDETDKLLLPLRNVMEGLGGSVAWNKETKMTEVSYRGRTLALKAGEEKAYLNGYEVILPEAAEIINGCLYADEILLAAYFTGDVDFNVESRQVTLQTMDNSVPVLAVNVLTGEKDGKSYEIEVPVIVGLNDSNYEKNLNETLWKELQTYGEDFLAVEKVQDGNDLLKLQVKAGMHTKDFISILWEGNKDGVPVKFAKNIDLLGQKTVTLEQMLTEASLEKVKGVAGEGWTADRFYLTEDGGLELLKGSNESSLNLYYWTTEGQQPAWKEAYQPLFGKK